MVVAEEWGMERETSGQDAPACRPPPLFSLSTAGGRQAGKRRETTLLTFVRQILPPRSKGGAPNVERLSTTQ